MKISTTKPVLTGLARYCTRTLLLTAVGISLPAMALPKPAKASVLAQAGAASGRSNFRRTLPLTKFYDTLAPLRAGKPGTLIRSERVYHYWLSAEASTVRILYHSRGGTGADVAASAVVLVPDRAAPPGGWPIIAWAHGFTGVARACAPSLMKNLYQGSFLSMYVNLGYAVVATDYAGLGTNFRNAFIDTRSNAADVIYSIPAARSAVPRLGQRWVAMGDSEGALAAVAVAEMEGEVRDPNYLGSIAVSGLADVGELYERMAQDPSHAMLAFLAYGIKTIFPEFQVGNMLTDKALPLYQRIETSCSGVSTGSQLSPDEILKANWKDDKFVQQFFRRNALGQKPAYGALLVIGSDVDPAIPSTMTAQVVARLCKQGDRVRFYTYQTPNPKGVIGESVRDQIAWIEARFAGRPAPSNCQ